MKLRYFKQLEKGGQLKSFRYVLRCGTCSSELAEIVLIPCSLGISTRTKAAAQRCFVKKVFLEIEINFEQMLLPRSFICYLIRKKTKKEREHIT